MGPNGVNFYKSNGVNKKIPWAREKYRRIDSLRPLGQGEIQEDRFFKALGAREYRRNEKRQGPFFQIVFLVRRLIPCRCRCLLGQPMYCS